MEPMSATRAHAARRALVASAGVASAIAAHAVTMGGLDLLPIAPALWAMLIGLAAVLGRRRRPFRARGIAATASLVVAVQVAMHAGMVVAPWAFGLSVHHAEPFITPASALAHVVAAVVLIALVAWGERLLAVLSAVARAILGDAPPRCRRTACITRLRVPAGPSWATGGLRRAIPSRGPPVPA
jgi:hypothetical protein